MIDTPRPGGNRPAMSAAQDLIAQLGLSPHPEGGWYRETWRAPAAAGARPSSTAILFLLGTGDRSHWHTVDADEIWIWQGGDPVALQLSPDAGTASRTIILGPESSHSLQAVVPTGQWQAASPVEGPHGYALVSCVVAPGFDFSGFVLAPPGWEPGA